MSMRMNSVQIDLCVVIEILMGQHRNISIPKLLLYPVQDATTIVD